MEYATAPWKVLKSPQVSLTVRSSAWRYLASEMDPSKDYLVLTRSGSGWIVGVLPQDRASGAKDTLKVRLNHYTVLVPRAEWLSQLNGRQLQYAAGALFIV